jgi:hypothetical protein
MVSTTGTETSSDTANDITHAPDPVKYAQLKKELAEKRTELSRQYRNALTAAEKNAILERASSVLESHLLKMTHCWRGTPWDFNGTCKTPGSGKIACGYFVSTVLQDAGVKCERIRLAQQPSQRIIATFLKRSDMRINAGVTYDNFLEQEIAQGSGWRIVGLDRHVGFLVIEEDGRTRFIHSNPGRPQVVLDEPREKSAYLRNSNYRVTGNITANKPFLEGWLTEKNWPTKTGQ